MRHAKGFWEDKVVLITGGSSGIGLAVARLLAGKGARLWLMARDPQKLEAARGEMSALDARFCGILPADVTDPAGVAQAIRTVEQQTGAPDVVIASAGIVEPGYFQELSLETFSKTMEVNFLGAVNVIKACLPGMLARKSGHVALISSAAGYLGVAGYTAYSPSKYALRGFAEALRMEMRYAGISVSVVYPPDTDTPQLAYERSFKIPEIDILRQLDGIASPQEVAKAIIRGIERKRFIIAPLASNHLFYHVIRWLDTGSFFIIDWLSDLGRKRAGKTS